MNYTDRTSTLTRSLDRWYTITFILVACSCLGVTITSLYHAYHPAPIIHTSEEIAIPHYGAANYALYEETCTILNAIPDAIQLSSYTYTKPQTLQIVADAPNAHATQDLISTLQACNYTTIQQLTVTPRDENVTITVHVRHGKNS